MRKTTWLYAGIILFLAALSVWLLGDRNTDTTLKDLKEEYRFYVEDTAAVDKIVMYDKTPSRVELTRVEKAWMVDGKHPARTDAIEVLLLTLNRMQMRNFIPERMQETVIKRMSVYGTTVEIYSDGKLLRTLIVGTDTPDEMATYMMIKGASAPYAVHIPGFNGFLSTRFFAEPWLWYKRIITDMDPRTVTSVNLLYPDSLQKSFELKVEDNENYLLKSALGDDLVANPPAVHQFLVAVSKMRYEGAIIPTDPIFARKDSLLASTPVFDLTVTSESGSINLKGYKIKGPEEAYDPEAEAPEYDPDRLHGIINDDQMVLIQYYALRQVLVPASFLARP